ncbi:MAG: Ig-like domain-containing protein [Andreesenia angusta]|nr:Ig-like domain-containing protein [Andreesenia angusta]
MNKRTRMALIFSLITVLSMSFISSFSFGDIDKKLTITVVGKDNLFQEKREYTLAELESDENFKQDISKDRKYNFNKVESDREFKDINANGISIENLINSLGVDKEEINNIEFKDNENQVFTKTKDELLNEKYYFTEDSEKSKVDTILSVKDDYKKSEKDKKDAFTFLAGLTEEEYNSKTIPYKKNINSIKVSLLKDIPTEEQFKIQGDREITIDNTGQKQLSTNFQKDNYLNGELKWVSSDPSKVSVDENGLLKYLTDGEVTITAIYKYKDKELKDSIIVNKKEDPVPTPDPNPTPDPVPTPDPPSSGGNVLDDSDITDRVIELTIDDDSGGSSGGNSSGGSSSGGNSSSGNNSGGSSIRRTPSTTRRPSTSSGTTPSSSSRTRRTPSSANSSSSSRNSGSNRDSNTSRSRRSGTIRRITRSTTSRDDEESEENQDENLRADRGVLTDADNTDERVNIGESRWKVFEVEQEEREMPKLDLSGEVNPIVMIVLAVIVIIGGVQRYIKYLGSI